MQHHTFFETGDDTYRGVAFTPDALGCDQVEVVASLDFATNTESEVNMEAARRYARLLYAAPEMLASLETILTAPNAGKAADAIAEARPVLARIHQALT